MEFMYKKHDLIAVTIFVFLITIDIVHRILNSIYKPFTGFIDVAMHGILFLSGMVYILSLTYLVLRLSDRFNQTTSKKYNLLIPSILILVLIGEAIYAYKYGHTDNIKKMNSNGGYYMLYPTYFGGILQGVLTALVAKATFKNRKILFSMFFIAQLWIAVPLVCDGLFYTEGSARGTGVLAQIPIISDWIWGYLFSLLLFLPIIAFYFLILSLMQIIFQYSQRNTVKFNLSIWFNLNTFALALSILFLCFQMSGWVDFFAD
jgi:hypothetical protein